MFAIIVIGTSWGGLNALSTIVGGLPAGFTVPIAVVQHRGRESAGLLCQLLQDHTALQVTEVVDKEPLHPGVVYVAPPDYHTLVERGFFSLSTDAPVRFSRPSINVTFWSAADAYGARVIGVVLTGANADGSSGLRHIADRGGHAVIQDPATAESPIMPSSARALVAEAHVLPLARIADHLIATARA